MNDFTFRQRLEKHNNPEEVRQRLAASNYNQQHARIAQEYLDSLERTESAKATECSEVREEESLSISRKALEISAEANSIASKASSDARRANIIAITAIVLATIIAILQAKDQVIWLLQKFSLLPP